MATNEDLEEPKKVVQFVKGYPFPNHHFFQAENIASSLEYVPRDDDVILNSFPKTGTVWTQYIIWQIIGKGDSRPTFMELNFKLVPFMEVCGAKPIEYMTSSPRLYKNHFAYDWTEHNPRAKHIYVYRNPADTLVSYYHFNNEISGKFFEFDEYYELFLNGANAYGDFFDHFLSYYAHRNDDNLLMVSYEEFHDNMSSQILKIAKFLGDEFYQPLLQDENRIKEIREITSFDNMKKTLAPNTIPEKEINNDKEIKFFRKGKIGDSKNHLSAEQINQLNQKIKEKMKGTEYVDKWLV